MIVLCCNSVSGTEGIHSVSFRAKKTLSVKQSLSKFAENKSGVLLHSVSIEEAEGGLWDLVL